MIAKSIVDSIALPSADAEFIENYIEEKGINSDKTAGNIKSAIKEFLAVYQGSLADVDVADVESYIAALATTGRKMASQKAYYKMVRNLVQAQRLDEAKVTKIVRVNPLDLFDMKTTFPMEDPHKETTLAEDRAEIQEQTYSLEQMKNLILHAKEITDAASPKEVANRCFFPVVLLQIFSSPRLSETLTIKLVNLDLKERMLKSGVVRNARKSKTIYGYFPQSVATQLKEWIARNNVTGPWLFSGYLEHRLSIAYFRTLFQKCGFKSHHFRHTLYTGMNDNEATKQNIKEIEKLSNHAHSGVVQRAYVKSHLEVQRDLYDKHLPPIYRELAKWLDSI